MPSKRTRSLFSLTCGCRDSTAISISLSPDKSSDTIKDPPSTVTDTRTTATTPTPTVASASSYISDDDASNTPSFSFLLRQLNELEKNVLEWAPPIEEEADESSSSPPPPPPAERTHRRWRSEGGGRVEESVAVVKESEDPLGDFRRSMLQMIVENEIVDSDELHELLRKFLQLNSRRHHDVILRAFSEIWSDEVFAGYENTPDLLRRSRSNYSARRRR